MNVTVYSKSGCPQCVFTKKFLESQNIYFTEKRVDLNEIFLKEVTAMGYRSLPVVTSDQEDYFFGYNINKLQDLVLKCQQ